MKVEKVVKPPQKPVVRSILTDGDKRPPPFQFNPDKKPMMRHPNTFTVIVPKGNAMNVYDCTILEIQNLMPPPKKLPILTSNNSFIASWLPTATWAARTWA